MLSKELLLDYLRANGIKFRDSGDKVQHQCLSPHHLEENPSAYTSFKSDEVFSYCSSCGYFIDTINLAKLLNYEIDELQLFISQINNILKATEVEENSESKIYAPINMGIFNKEYRGISAKTFSDVNCYITEPEAYYGKRLIFPIRDYKGNLRTFEAISTNKERTPKVLRPKNILTDSYFGFEEFIQGNLVFINEGLFSALSFKELGYNAVFNFGVASVEKKLKGLLVRGVTHIVLSGDNDEAGRKFNKECYFYLRSLFQVTYLKHPWKALEKSDANDYLKQGILQDIIDKTLKDFYE